MEIIEGTAANIEEHERHRRFVQGLYDREEKGLQAQQQVRQHAYWRVSGEFGEQYQRYRTQQ